MQFGLLYEMQRPFEGTSVDWNTLYRETLEQCALADQVGFDALWFVEHHFLTGFSGSPCPEVIFGALSQVTKRVRIGFGVSILPYHHPVRVAERVAMVDQLTNGRVEVGTGRSNAYELTGLGVDPRDTRAMWEESITMLPQIWQSEEEFSWEGRFWKVPPRRVLPKPFQKPHPNLYLACTQTDSFDVAAEKGIGVLSSATFATNILAEHVKRYRERVKQSTPVGATINEFWGSNVASYCGEDDTEAKELGARSLKTFFGPDKPYIRDRVNAYEDLLESWGGVPDHLKADFGRWLRQSDDEHKEQARQVGISLDSGPGAARAAFGEMDADTLRDRGIIIAGDPDNCIRGIQLYEDAGVDQVLLIMQTETIPHEKVLSSLELFGKHVIPAFRQRSQNSGVRSQERERQHVGAAGEP
jgi:alkanesulfonate monooxygenase SsuD/methylene tetrahydromethanopterin reductase-like flavin-dependent oxidoreductase (luciferase family)